MTKEKMKNKLFLNQDKIDDVPDRVLQEYSQFVNMEKILANDFAITALTPSAFKTLGACSLEEPQPKFSEATT